VVITNLFQTNLFPHQNRNASGLHVILRENLECLRTPGPLSRHLSDTDVGIIALRCQCQGTSPVRRFGAPRQARRVHGSVRERTSSMWGIIIHTTDPRMMKDVIGMHRSEEIGGLDRDLHLIGISRPRHSDPWVFALLLNRSEVSPTFLHSDRALSAAYSPVRIVQDGPDFWKAIEQAPQPTTHSPNLFPPTSTTIVLLGPTIRIWRPTSHQTSRLRLRTMNAQE
jgi:hypothetical protein